MKSRYILRQAAETDLEAIWLYTMQDWGLEQADHYIGALLSRFDWLAEHPSAGRKRPDIKPGYHCYPEGRHLIFYTVRPDRIEIIGVVHQGMDYLDHLGGEL
jgi:toxin ParE1/3/4